MIQSRRGFLTGFGAILATPAIVQITNIMPVKALPLGLNERNVLEEAAKICWTTPPCTGSAVRSFC